MTRYYIMNAEKSWYTFSTNKKGRTIDRSRNLSLPFQTIQKDKIRFGYDKILSGLMDKSLYDNCDLYDWQNS